MFLFPRSDRKRKEFLAQRMEPWRVALLLFSFTGITIVVQLLSARETTREVEVRGLLDVSRYVSENLNRQFAGLDEALLNIRRDYQSSLLTTSSTETSRRLHLLTNVIQAVRRLAVYDANGTVVAADMDADVGKDHYSKEFFKDIRSNPDPDVVYLSKPTENDGERVALRLSRAIVDETGQFTGVVSASLDEEFFAYTI